MDIAGLKNSVKALAAEGAALRAAIQQASGPERHRLWGEKRRVGSQARQALLAYGFARGVPYRRIEPRCREGNQAQPAAITRALEAVGGAAPAATVLDQWLGASPSGRLTEVAMG
jgi:hypothetical protein